MRLPSFAAMDKRSGVPGAERGRRHGLAAVPDVCTALKTPAARSLRGR